MFGMENNASSLAARRQAFLISYGYPAVDVYENFEALTELIGHVPPVRTRTADDLAPDFDHEGNVRLTFFSTVTPYTSAFVKVAAAEAPAFAADLERSGLWRLVSWAKL